MREVVDHAHLCLCMFQSLFVADTIYLPFVSSLQNYSRQSCHMYYQSAISIVSAFPYTLSIKRLLLLSNILFLIHRMLYNSIFQSDNSIPHPIPIIQPPLLLSITKNQSLQEYLAQVRQKQLFQQIGNRILHSTPLPELGDTIILSFQEAESIRITRHFSRGFPVYDDNIAPIFLLLSPHTIVQILQLLLLEQKFIIHSFYPSVIINVVHTLKRFLFPWKYAGSFIPLLPSSMLLAVQVPGSYLIGIETVK